MNKKTLLASLTFFLAGLLALIFYVMAQMSIEHLISCSSDEGGTRIPSRFCEYYMKNYRVSQNDIDELSDGAGLDYILNGENPKKYEIAEMFISKGLSVDGINHYNDKDITPLQAAVLFNDVERVKFLIKNGANVHIKSKGYGLTALELAKRLHKDRTDDDRSEIMKLLSTVSKI